MFCGNCGKKMSDGAKFCPNCGASVSTPAAPQWNAAPPQAPSAPRQYTPQAQKMSAPNGGKKGKGFGVLAAVGGVAVVAIVAAVVILGGFFSGPKGTLAKALVKSANAYQAASAAAGLPDLKKLAEDKKITQELSFRIDSISDDLSYYYSDASMLEGLGMSVTEGLNLPGKKLDMSLDITYGTTDVLSAWAAADDAVVTFGSPQFLGSNAYGFNTETLGKDFGNLGDVPDRFTSFSFNIFDILESFDNTVEVDKAAMKDLADAIEVEKSGKESITVNGYSADCTSYHVLIPQDALRTWFRAVVDAYQKNQSSNDALKNLMQALGVSAYDMEYVLDSEEMFEPLDEIIQMIGDVELDVYVNGGCIMAAEWSDKIEGTPVKVGAYFGGGKNYADDWSVELSADSVRVTVASTGNHSAEGGEFTDETSITIRNGSESIKVTSEASWEPKKSSDNFSWSLKSSGFALNASGQLSAAKNSMDLKLDKLSVNALGTNFVTMSASYSVKPFDAQNLPSKSATMLSNMDMDDFEDLHVDVVNNVEDWVLGLMDEIPELAYMFW